MVLPAPIATVVDEAVGRRHRAEPITGSSGGPAGNARLTAWTGLILLVLILGQLVTLLDVQGLIGWHVVLGALLVPVALLKTASTSWRVARYYTHRADYRAAGPPPTPLRVLGPLVVASTLGLLGTGLSLVALGPHASRESFVTVLGQQISALTLHQVLFLVFAAVTGLHLVARIVPALTIVAGRGGSAGRVPGRSQRLVVLAGTLVAAALAAVLVLDAVGPWRHDGDGPHRSGHARGVSGSAAPVR